MIDWRDPDARLMDGPTAVSALRWALAGATVVGLHVGGAWVAMNMRAQAESMGEPPAAIMMELAPLAVAPETPEQDIAPGPEMVEAQEQPEPEPKPVEEAEPEPEAKPVETPEPEPEPLPPPPETEIKPPELPKKEEAEAVLPPPPKPKPKPKEVRRKKQQKAAPRTTAPPSARAQIADRAAAPAQGASDSSVSPASWRGALMAHLNRNKRFPPGGGRGTATVAFTINRSGAVVSARLVRSAGDGVLDAEAVNLVRRASPVPAPPSSVGGSSISLTVPIRFSR